MIPLCIPEVRGNEWKYIKDCLDTNWVSSVGSYVDKFEDDFANYLEAKAAVVTMNGTAALELALRTLGIGKGDEVIVSSLTFISPVNTIRYVGAEPVFVDVCKDTWVMDESKIEELITSKTKAILPVHIYGNLVNMDKVMDIARKHDLFVIEDATESLGAIYKGKKAGNIGDIGCFSFNGNKLITTGAGGMLVTNKEDLAKRAKYLSTQTKSVLENGAFYHEELGYNFRMPNILAAMGCAQLEMVEEYVNAKLGHAKEYNNLLENVIGIKIPTEKDDTTNVNWLYSILVQDEFPLTRDELLNKLKDNGIQSRSFFMPVHNMPPYINCKHGDMSITNSISFKGINLPSSVELKKEEIEKICKVIKEC
ncbi:aminotransferase class I/II-fold pyridoxal phosphate-dependent enzyme [Clostridium bowmanii]|uniref:aminotransferase class V-fold PLP-dependent enzyme n=1 Tax=Clostridium bowmanii TaxID=132925 RepID=UPI001C0B3557|nr:aminotransferase class V-fold PLP-dependent enzyme [Clostridium bowmanii]MBU3190604.1 aminotransferase class I/II-fold pyridoxal phosphate-dependent enzyme [Clostridium bowmanii]MCA1075137.1 aminotransferase class I/II-fold pyridoxal phosphate-dependent enzyme [Clostridium bowmanii]